MKIRRYKKVNRNLGFYVNNFAFRKPYQLLVDGTFCVAALNNKVNISNDVPKYLQSQIKFLTTQCSIIEMENLGPKLNGALLVLKQYVIHKCGHEGKPLPGAQCILSMVSRRNPGHYFVCTQDRDLQEQVRNLSAVPLLYMHFKTPVLEAPSTESVKQAHEKASGLLQSEIDMLKELKEKEELSKTKPPKKSKKKKGPNPLSCKKKQKKEGKPEKEKQRRKRVRLPQQVLNEVMKKTYQKVSEIC